jgi:hypothetical protein
MSAKKATQKEEAAPKAKSPVKTGIVPPKGERDVVK